MIKLALNGFYRTNHQSMKDWAECAVNAARLLAEAPLTAAALAVHALAGAMTGEAEHAQADRSEAATLIESLSDEQLAFRLDAATYLAGANDPGLSESPMRGITETRSRSWAARGTRGSAPRLSWRFALAVVPL